MSFSSAVESQAGDEVAAPLSQRCTVICLFPGLDRVSLVKSLNTTLEEPLFVDLDSTPFRQQGTDVGGSTDEQAFVERYLEAVEAYRTRKCVVLLSCHEQVRTALLEKGIRFSIMLPAMGQRPWWLERARGYLVAEREEAKQLEASTPSDSVAEGYWMQLYPILSLYYDDWHSSCVQQHYDCRQAWVEGRSAGVPLYYMCEQNDARKELLFMSQQLFVDAGDEVVDSSDEESSDDDENKSEYGSLPDLEGLAL